MFGTYFVVLLSFFFSFFFFPFSMCTKKFLTLTFRSLRNQEKKRSIFSYLKQQKQIITSFKKLSLTLKYKITQVKSRLNFFLISDKFQHDVTKVETRESIAPEHKAVFLSTDLNGEFDRGPGLWKFNNTFLQDECYLTIDETLLSMYPTKTHCCI